MMRSSRRRPCPTPRPPKCESQRAPLRYVRWPQSCGPDPYENGTIAPKGKPWPYKAEERLESFSARVLLATQAPPVHSVLQEAGFVPDRASSSGQPWQKTTAQSQAPQRRDCLESPHALCWHTLQLLQRLPLPRRCRCGLCRRSL